MGITQTDISNECRSSLVVQPNSQFIPLLPTETNNALLSTIQITMSNNQPLKPILGKHVPRACLECRKRHLKCGGQEPICERCQKNDRECSYVKSNRGGSRKKGVYLKETLIPQHERIGKRNNHKSDMLPCVKNGLGHMADNLECKEDCMKIAHYNSAPPCMKGDHQFSDGTKRGDINLHPVFNESKDDDPINYIFADSSLQSSLDKCYISPSLVRELDTPTIISKFYNSFYNAHPFLPPQNEIMTYLDSIPYKYDLLLAMKLIAEGETSNKFARDIETINFLVTSLINYIRQIGKDFISLQSLLLLAMASHISSLHDLSTKIREATISLALEMKLNFIDEKNVPAVFLDVNGFLTERDHHHSANGMTPSDSEARSVADVLFEAERVSSIPREILVETMRKTFWELYYFDSISGTASGHTKSRLAVQHCLVLYPTSIPLQIFDYKSRAEACKLVNDAISLNIAIQSNKDSLPHLNHMRAALGNWEMKLANPDTYGMPYLISKNGIVNEGVFESIMLLNYARIFTHRPFSYLWRSDVSKHPRCTDEEGVDDPCPPLNNKEPDNATDSRKINETRKTIDSANFLVKTLLDTDPSQTCKRTPFLACALAFSCLVHLSAYAWVESNLNVLEAEDEATRQISASELDVYTEYIKLEIGSMLQISRHWSLSAKLITHISETLCRVSPKLFRKVQAGILGLGFNISTLINNPAQNAIKSSKSVTSTPTNETTGHSSPTINSSAQKSTDTPATKSSSGGNIDHSNLLLLDNPQLFGAKNMTPTLTECRSRVDLRPLVSGIPSAPQFAVNGRETTEGNVGNVNFMAEFNDLVNGMNANNVDPVNATVLGFPTDAQDYDFLDPPSPTSDTGCDWVDRHAFQFDAFLTPN